MKPSASLLERALGVFVLLGVCLAAFLWVGKTLLPRPVENLYLDARRLAALRTFERAIVPLRALREDVAPAPETIREKFAFCTDAPKAREALSARAKRADPCASASPTEELACHVKTINARLAEMSERSAERALGEPHAVSVDRWIEAMRDPQQPVGCREAFAAARQLAARDGRLLSLLAWRDLSPKNVVAKQFASEQSVKVAGRLLEQRNPWGGVPGCIYYGDATKNGRLLYVSDRQQSNRSACLAMRPKGAQEKDLQAEAEPPASLEVILAELDHIRLPWRDLYRAYTEKAMAPIASAQAIPVAASHGPNRLARAKHEVDAGFSVQLTIDPDAQRIVQETSLCYAGDAAACERIGVATDRKFHEFSAGMYEKAAVRMAAVALIDVATGRIEALGSAHTDCYRQEYDGPGRSARDCPGLPSTPRYEPDRLLNHALYTPALPGSIIKPIMATGFLADDGYRGKIARDRVAADFVRLQDELKGSDSIAFLNRMFCIDKGWTNCDRPRRVQQAALAFGWNAGCAEPSFRCGRLNALFGVADVTRIRSDTNRSPLGTSVLYGRLLTEPASVKKPADLRMMADFSFEPRHAAACASGAFYSGSGRNRGWRKCRQGHLVYLESEGWGQGNARATALGAAGMVSRLAAAANGQQSQRMPYLVERISDARGEPFDLAVHQFGFTEPVKIAIPQSDASLIVKGMISHKARGTPAGSRSGTAHVACARVFGTAECNRIDWIAGKTGTPPYGNDGLTLKEIREKCRAAPKNAGDGEREQWLAACSAEQPYKWYVAAFRSSDATPGFDKAIAVLTERNWHRSGPLAGKVQSPGDLDGMNISAELAFRIVARLRKS
ncbi:MAG TPA: hypothetical protein VFX67_08670 [Burkholderiales bacterium]|nr:hypothetical protein [Burkholderiales bacterium]